MIAANELRVGNLIQERDGFIMSVVSIHDDGTIYCDFEGNEGDVWEFDDKNPCYGVKLTEEILLRCGGVENPYQDRIEIGDIHFEIDKTKGSTKIWCEKYPHLTKLHRLQNLFFELNNKELEVNL